jgi:hyperosmotically inducible protein
MLRNTFCVLALICTLITPGYSFPVDTNAADFVQAGQIDGFEPPVMNDEYDMSSERLRLIQKVRRELVTLPRYGVFDWLEYEVGADGAVKLMGQVVRPITKSDATGRIKRIEGVSRVINEIEVLPLSPMDDRLRIKLYRSLFNFNSPLFRYATGSVPPIHLIVNRGRATLKGVVATEGDRNFAYIKANTVPGLFEVNNELRVEKPSVR